ncbi:MAG: dTMP kinase [Ferrovibrio sp.]|uniref:dTMP kinase n=1 Tax=Ferrovibrio sp. TaxID=1917215 RepID=UPI002621136C|nr:dTMP kinase [Ferrovibrio sp.]MCW0235324.1 dTMP kinase [Ferrovibrio sp.]
MTASRGRFITLEGGEGAGKSTQAKRLAAALAARGVEAVLTREPGGTPGAEDIRALLVTGDPARWDAMTETLLHYAARRAHVEKMVKPALARGTWVISDRFADSTMAYQGYAGSVGRDAVAGLHKLVLGDFQPDLTLVLDLPVETGLQRARQRMQGQVQSAALAEDRYERMGLTFHESLRAAFHDIAAREPQRCRLIDAGGDPDQVAAALWQAVAAKFNLIP